LDFCALGTVRAKKNIRADNSVAEFRGPGIHHRFDDSPDDYDMDMDQRTRDFGHPGSSSRIILLGNGTESNTDHAHDDDGDVDMEDSGEADELEEKDLEEQVRKGQVDNTKGSSSKAPNGERSQREETPGPQEQSIEATTTVEEVNPTPEQVKSPPPTASGTDKVTPANTSNFTDSSK